MLKSKQDAVEQGIIKNIVPLLIMKLLMLYLFFGYYDKERFENDRENYRNDAKYQNTLLKISCHYDNASNDTNNDFLSVEDSQLIELIDFLEHTFGKEQIKTFGKNVDTENNCKLVSEVFIYSLV